MLVFERLRLSVLLGQCLCFVLILSTEVAAMCQVKRRVLVRTVLMHGCISFKDKQRQKAPKS